jgi:hypothetical protein
MSTNDPREVTSTTSQGKPDGGFFGLLHAVALIAMVVGATCSLIFMLHAGQQTPRLLLVPFTIWVLSPFVALLWANTVRKMR